MIKSFTAATADQVRNYLLLETLLTAILFSATLVHFPDRPLVRAF